LSSYQQLTENDVAKVICIIDTKTGESQVKAEGYSGETCKSKTGLFTSVLGTVTADTPTEEMYSVQEVNQQVETSN
jgi:hypothetical protein